MPEYSTPLQCQTLTNGHGKRVAHENKNPSFFKSCAPKKKIIRIKILNFKLS